MAYVFQRLVRRALEGPPKIAERRVQRPALPRGVARGPSRRRRRRRRRRRGRRAENVAGALLIDATATRSSRTCASTAPRSRRRDGLRQVVAAPLMLMQQPGVKRPKMMVSQPRRIAAPRCATACARCRAARAWPAAARPRREGRGAGHAAVVATAGYLVRLLAVPGELNDHTHLIVDEVHEQSVNRRPAPAVRRLVATNPKIRVVPCRRRCAPTPARLFRARVAAHFVGARRFVNEVFYADELAEGAPAGR